MKDENGRGVIRLHDKTTHGGEVITASDDLTAQGVPVALKDLPDMVSEVWRPVQDHSAKQHAQSPRYAGRFSQRSGGVRA